MGRRNQLTAGRRPECGRLGERKRRIRSGTPKGPRRVCVAAKAGIIRIRHRTGAIHINGRLRSIYGYDYSVANSDAVPGNALGRGTVETYIADKDDLTVPARRIKLKDGVGVQRSTSHSQHTITAESGSLNRIGVHIGIGQVDLARAGRVANIHGAAICL